MKAVVEHGFFADEARLMLASAATVKSYDVIFATNCCGTGRFR